MLPRSIAAINVNELAFHALMPFFLRGSNFIEPQLLLEGGGVVNLLIATKCLCKIRIY